MDIDLTPDQEFLVRQGVAGGRYRDRAGAVKRRGRARLSAGPGMR